MSNKKIPVRMRNCSSVKSAFQNRMEEQMHTSGRSFKHFKSWEDILSILQEHSFAPAGLAYEFINTCPQTFDPDLRLKLVRCYQASILPRIRDNRDEPEVVTSYFSVLLSLSSHYSAGEFLKQKTFILAEYFKHYDIPVPKNVQERIAFCVRKRKKLGGFSDKDFIDAGYIISNSDDKKILINEKSGDIIIVENKM